MGPITLVRVDDAEVSARTGTPEYVSMMQRLKNMISSILENNKSKSSIAVLDGVRALAIFIVITFHLYDQVKLYNVQWLSKYFLAIIHEGFSGVTLFFVLSGFLLFLPYIKSLLFDQSWPSVRQFYLRRMLRIMPGYYLALFLMIILLAPSYLRPGHWTQLLLFLTFFMDSSHATFQQLNGPFWTLAVEWQFYMLLPWIALAMRFVVQRGTLRHRVKVLCLCLGLLIVWGIGTRFCGYYLTGHPTQSFGVPHIVLQVLVALLYGTGGAGIHGKFYEDFAIGMLIAVCYTLTRTLPQGTWFKWLRRLSPFFAVGSVVWLITMAYWNSHILLLVSPTGHVGTFLYQATLIQTFHEFGLALGYGAFVMAVLFGGPLLTHIFLWTPLRWIGLISYSMYIWHSLIMEAFVTAVAPFVHDIPQLALLDAVWLFVVVIPFSFAYFALVERPFIKLSGSLRKNRNKIPPAPSRVQEMSYHQQHKP
jgi:peptidoglycan/LPS O-acetylase OafA/YrhL